MFKIFTKGNYFYIIDNSNNTEFEGLKKDVRVRRLTTNSTSFYFDNVNSWQDINTGLDISKIKKEDGTSYTLEEFLDFKNNHTGNFNSGETLTTTTYNFIINETINSGEILHQNYTILGVLANKPTQIIFETLPPSGIIINYNVLQNNILSLYIENQTGINYILSQNLIINN